METPEAVVPVQVTIVVHYEVTVGDILALEEAEFTPEFTNFNAFQEIERFLISKKNIATKLVTNKDNTVNEFYYDPSNGETDNLFHLFVIAVDRQGLLRYFSIRDTDFTTGAQVRLCLSTCRIFVL